MLNLSLFNPSHKISRDMWMWADLICDVELVVVQIKRATCFNICCCQCRYIMTWLWHNPDKCSPFHPGPPLPVPRLAWPDPVNLDHRWLTHEQAKLHCRGDYLHTSSRLYHVLHWKVELFIMGHRKNVSWHATLSCPSHIFHNLLI